MEQGFRLDYCNIKDQAGALSRSFVLGLRNTFSVRSFVETGTYFGDTIATLCNDFDSLQSIELSAEYHARAATRFSGQPQVQLINADSTTGLETAIGRLSGARAIFWLDAHYSGGDTAKGQSNTPIESELRVILAQPQRSDVIIIDDLRYFWPTRPGFLQHEALLGYPSVDELVHLLNCGASRYDCFALCDALIAIPANLRHSYAVSPLLRALTQSRKGVSAKADLSSIERSIAAATGPELKALVEIPDYLSAQSEYGLGGHYFYWRSLVNFSRGERELTRADADVAVRCGVIPDGSMLEQVGPTAPVAQGEMPSGTAYSAHKVVIQAAGAPMEAGTLLPSIRRVGVVLRRYMHLMHLATSILMLLLSKREQLLGARSEQNVVGTKNAETRDAWIAATLAALPAGARLLDAGAGECQYKKHCGHLRYVAQDIAVYDGKGETGLQTGSWDFSKIDIVSDILAIPEPDASFDAVLCTEVLEHLPDPIRAIDEMARLLRPGGNIIITAPFWSLTHFAPYHYATGFNRYFYEYHLGRLGFDIVDMIPNGNFFECVGQELRRVSDMHQRFVKGENDTVLESFATQILLGKLERLSARDDGSHEMLHFGCHVRAVKRPNP